MARSSSAALYLYGSSAGELQGRFHVDPLLYTQIPRYSGGLIMFVIGAIVPTLRWKYREPYSWPPASNAEPQREPPRGAGFLDAKPSSQHSSLSTLTLSTENIQKQNGTLEDFGSSHSQNARSGGTEISQISIIKLAMCKIAYQDKKPKNTSTSQYRLKFCETQMGYRRSGPELRHRLHTALSLSSALSLFFPHRPPPNLDISMHVNVTYSPSGSFPSSDSDGIPLIRCYVAPWDVVFV